MIIRFLPYIIVAVLCFGTGWKIKSWQVAERDLAIMEARDAMISEYRMNEAGKAKILEDKLASLRANERTIEREKIKIIDRPVYHNECIDADGVRLIEAARAGKSGATESPGDVSGVK